MRIVLTGNQTEELNRFSKSISQVLGQCEFICFTDPMLSAKYIWHHPVDIVFAEERMRPVSGIDLLRVIRKEKPEMPVVILADDDGMQQQAVELIADGYWKRPVRREQLESIPKIIENTDWR
jgi:two-component SAPR family response regulator